MSVLPHWLKWEELISQFFPKDGEYKDGMRPEQEVAARHIAENGGGTIEIGVGKGKSALAVMLARAARKHFKRCILVTPTKAEVEQYRLRFPDDFTVVVGRNDYPCYYFEKDKDTLGAVDRKYKYTAGDVPTSLCHTCPHYVDSHAGETLERGAARCPYYHAKHLALTSRKPVLTTFAFYLFAKLYSGIFQDVDLLIIDEAHRVPEMIRSLLSYDITDWHLEKAVEILEKVDEHEAAATLDHFRARMIKIVNAKKKFSERGTLLNADEISELINILEKIDAVAVSRAVTSAIRQDILDVEENLEVLRKVEGVVKNLRRYIRSLEFSLPKADRGPLAYTYAFHVKEKGERDKVMNKLVVCSHYIAPLVRKCLLGETTVAMSGTIGDNDMFAQESGIKLPFLCVSTSFPADKTRIYMPTDTPSLAFRMRKRGTVTNVLRRLARSAKRFAHKGARSLLVVVSEVERVKLTDILGQEGVKALSYGNGLSARDAVTRFKGGEADALVGTFAHFGEGINLERQVAPVIFCLRPAYPPGDDPRAQFEERRYGVNGKWKYWNYRAMLAVRQVRGRNIRSDDDFGVIIFIDARFRNIVFAALPEALRVSYRGDFTLDQCVKDAMKLLGGQ